MDLMLSHLGLYLKSCLAFWTGLYLLFCFLWGLPSLMLHMTSVGLLLCLLSYFRLPPPDPSSTLTLLGPDPRNFDGSPARRSRTDLGTVAHRAAGDDAPEYTLEALRTAKKNGAKCVEFDVSFTRDGVAVVIHDDTVDRTTDGKGRVDEMDLADLQKLDAAEHHVLKEFFSPARVPTVDDFVQECLRLDLKMIIDLKSWQTPEQTVHFVTDLFAKHDGLHTKALVSTFFPHLAYLIRQKDPKIVMAMAWRPHYLSYETYGGNHLHHRPRFSSPFYHLAAVLADHVHKWALHDFLWYFIGLSAVLIHKDALTGEYIMRWREKGVRVLAWTVNSSLQKAYLVNFLRVTTLSDTMDQLPMDELVSKEGSSEGFDFVEDDKDEKNVEEVNESNA